MQRAGIVQPGILAQCLGLKTIWLYSVKQTHIGSGLLYYFLNERETGRNVYAQLEQSGNGEGGIIGIVMRQLLITLPHCGNSFPTPDDAAPHFI